MGYKYNLDSIHATIGLSQLRKLDEMNKRRRRIAKIYKEKLTSKIRFTVDSEEHYHIYHLFPIKIPTEIIKRDDMIIELKNRNIGSSVHFIPLHLHSFYKNRFPKENFPVANKVFSEILSIPMFPSMTNDDVDYVINNLNEILDK